MARLNLKAVEERVAQLGDRASYDREFIFDLLLAYGKPKGNVTRLRNGSLNVAEAPDREVAQKNVVYFREATEEPLQEIQRLRTAAHVLRYNPRFIIVVDQEYTELLAVDTKTGDNLSAPLREIPQHFTFFLPWAGMEKAQYVAEAHADVKAAEKMGTLFDELMKANPDILSHPDGPHGLNVFFIRLLFCFFAEDTGVFRENQFTQAVGSHTQEDGSNLSDFLDELFTALDTEDSEDKPSYLRDFPYVNGRLFTVRPTDVVPKFSAKARRHLIELGTLIWRDINPDIFGSMFQAVVGQQKRSELGQHYTSVPNILKTIEPLFLDDLKQRFDAGFDSRKKLENLLQRIRDIRVFDPACGSGNFLVIAYKELRRLEHSVMERLAELTSTGRLGDMEGAMPQLQVKYGVDTVDSGIPLDHFYGIEIDDFATEIAVLSLWIAKQQMNMEFEEKFGITQSIIPLREAGQIHHANAAHIDWNEVCPNDGESEIYLISNPPYVGSSMQTTEQKNEFQEVFGTRQFSANLDYISLWFVKGADYIRGTSARLAFVTTNSVAQGDHVSLMFPTVLTGGIEIGFCHTSFKWENNAKRNAGVTVAVIGLRNASTEPKHIYTGGIQIPADNINGYLTEGPTLYISRRSRPLSDQLSAMTFGSKPTDGGHLILSPAERDELLEASPGASEFLKKYMGAKELIKGIDRYCLWIDDGAVEQASAIPEISQRLELVRRVRSAPKTSGISKKFSEHPHRFIQRAYRPTDSIIVPRVSSEGREYIPIGFLGPDTVVSDAAFAVYDAEPWLFALLTSRIHMVWTRAVGGKMKTDYRYSNTIVYNNFPVPPLSEEMKERLTVAALRILDVREYHCEQTLAQLYDPEKMPGELRAAHQAVDELVDSIYSTKPYETDEQRLADLFALYQKMTEAKAAQKAAQKPTPRKRRTRS